ncbi:hypothetical protein [Luteimicrobium subarcticum]|uniref:Uncharacterized protein n=1 Tax=Luteimicrobium subarcticum TaxID=620910 RepID=A0A2M8WVC9_9MICO|nr:hypothetical protein [Luteimicrobium subarcticum]PJI94879.1 hypothetical protein CLV34_0727 [Luteimicrobium subarcticum]
MKRFVRRTVAAVAAFSALAAVVPAAAQAAPSRYDEYYHYMDTGKAAIPYHDTRWVPQGMTKWGENDLVIAYYDRYHTQKSIISIIDRASGRYVKMFHLDTTAHVGGLAMTSKYLWVSEDGHLRRYLRSALSGTSGRTLTTQARIAVAGKASYAFAEGEYVWVGTFNAEHRDWMYEYRVGSTGGLTYVQKKYTPSQVQGVVVTSSRIVWATSYGRDNDSHLVAWPRSTTYNGSSKIGNWVTAPNMAEGMVIAGGQLQVVYESSSDAYNGTADGNAADYIIRSVHHGSIPSLP